MEIDTEIFESFMKSVTERLTRQEKMIQMLVDDLNERNKDGKLYIRGERMYDSIHLATIPYIRTTALYQTATYLLLP